VLTLQQLHFGFSVNFNFICHFEFTAGQTLSCAIMCCCGDLLMSCSYSEQLLTEEAGGHNQVDLPLEFHILNLTEASFSFSCGNNTPSDFL
jgi:hypothetical protein